ncbi:redoxin [Leptospira inadai serovar Lyme str. 10]|uniref:Redoxin n=2 Tax=Leptospira inadai serovar Lyme TaxID=293084 RepID=V6H8A3_9LEPT|nr:redoxin domain-containing protein [Leptospira inadai]EQA35106.1 redoxin [Leptospira inadai serovar Lyme str. 10]PNV74191.1 thioredoxin family protein [Leptospira inadai serovar Lyme]
MKRAFFLFSILSIFVYSLSAMKPGDMAPDFSEKDISGKLRNLSEFKGKFLVLEWHNQGCPFVKKHYGSGNMQKLQKEVTAKGIVWLSVISSAPGKQGYVTPEEEKEYLKKSQASPSAVLFDSDGTMGKAYGAKTTPQMVLISPQGKILYNGAIDDKPSTDQSDIPSAKNYISAAIDEALAGKLISVSTSQPYGCSVKYE